MTDAPGIQWVQGTGTWTRLGALAGMTLPQAIAYCDQTPPWVYMRRLNLLDNGVITAIQSSYGAGCYSDTDNTNGQCMVDLERGEYFTDFTTPNTYKWYVRPAGSNWTVNGQSVAFKTHPNFVRNGITKDRTFFSAYEGYVSGIGGSTPKLESKAGVQPTTDANTHPTINSTFANFRTWAHNRVGGTADKWELQDYLSTAWVQLLYLIEYGGPDAQTLLSPGITNMHNDAGPNQASNTGHTSTLGNASGSVLHTFDYVPSVAPFTGYAMSYRGIENFYGNVFKFIDGINIKADYNPWIADHGFACDTFASPYVDTTLTLPSTGNYITNIAFTTDFDYGFLPSAVGGVGGLYDQYGLATGNRMVLNSGYWASGAGDGMFYTYNYFASKYHGYYLGGRLIYIG